MGQFSLIWLICSAAFILRDWILSIWESGTVGKRGVHAGGEADTGKWCFNDEIELDIASSSAFVLPQDAELRFRHNGLNVGGKYDQWKIIIEIWSTNYPWITISWKIFFAFT